MKTRNYILAIIIVFIFTLMCACLNDNSDNKTLELKEDKIMITFNFNKQSGYASNQFAVWVEDVEGNLVKTLYATRFTANGGYKSRIEAIPLWVEKSKLASMEKSQVDTITGATPKSGVLSYSWNLKDINGNYVPSGKYSFFVEGNLRWKNRVLYSGNIEIGDNTHVEKVDSKYFYESSNEQPSLSNDSIENSMITDVTASFVPALVK